MGLVSTRRLFCRYCVCNVPSIRTSTSEQRAELQAVWSAGKSGALPAKTPGRPFFPWGAEPKFATV